MVPHNKVSIYIATSESTIYPVNLSRPFSLHVFLLRGGEVIMIHLDHIHKKLYHGIFIRAYIPVFLLQQAAYLVLITTPGCPPRK